MASWTVERLQDEVERLATRGLSREAFFAELSPRVRRVIPNDAACWHTIDPATRLLTTDAPGELIDRGIFDAPGAAAAGEVIVRSEYVLSDPNSFAGLAARRVPVGILEHATRGRPERTARYRELLAPAGIPHELRAAFVIRGRAWGSVHIARRAASGPFTQRDADALARATGAIARGIRASLRFDAARRVTGEEAPGMVLLAPDDTPELVTPPAVELLDALRTVPGQLPTALLAVAGHVRTGDPGAGVVTVPSAIGWITLHASLPGDGRVAIVLERAAGPQSAAVRLEVHGVTARERDVATLLARGLGYAEIAEELVLSPHTVQDHVKSLFAKVGVSSRQELVAQVFLTEYLPEVARATPLTSYGRFDRCT